MLTAPLTVLKITTGGHLIFKTVRGAVKINY
jgi:hypothetical protein